MAGYNEIHSIQMFGDTLHISFNQEPDEKFFTDIAAKHNKKNMRWQKVDPSIEDIFLSLMEGNE